MTWWIACIKLVWASIERNPGGRVAGTTSECVWHFDRSCRLPSIGVSQLTALPTVQRVGGLFHFCENSGEVTLWGCGSVRPVLSLVLSGVGCGERCKHSMYTFQRWKPICASPQNTGNLYLVSSELDGSFLYCCMINSSHAVHVGRCLIFSLMWLLEHAAEIRFQLKLFLRMIHFKLI